jgi:Leucine-rich repeat (LRR) protein
MSDYVTKTQGKTKWTINDYNNWIDAGAPLNENVKQLLLFNSGLTDEQLVDKFDNLPNVNYIKLYGNNITYLPPSIGKLQQLVFLYLSNTKITTLPDELKNNHNNLRITIGDTPLLQNPPTELLNWPSNIKFEPSLQINHEDT